MQIPAIGLFAHRQALKHQSTMVKALQRLSSGYRINSAADDPAGLAMSERMRARITGTNQAVLNAKNGLDMVNTAEASLSTVSSALQRLVDIGEQAATGTLSDADRHHLQQEAKELLEAIKAAGETSQYAQQKLLNETRNVNLQVGTTAEEYDKLVVKMPSLKEALSMLDDFSLETQAQAQQSLDKVKQAVDVVSGLRGGLGAQANRLERTIRNLEDTSENLTDAESRIRDADMAKEMMEYTRAQVLSQAAQAVMAHAMEQPQRTLELLKSGMG